MRWRLAALWLAWALGPVACRGERDARPDAASSASSASSASVASVASSASAPGSLAPAEAGAPPAPSDARAKLPGRTDGCPEGMVRVEGEYCPVVIETCLEHHREYESNKQDKNVSERCLRYQAPSRCLSKQREHLSFCMDRYEYPNREGELPQTLTPWLEAVEVCKAEGKRLCTEDEFNFACEGPDILPYVNGFVRDQAACNIDRHYEQPDHSRVLPTYKTCLETPWCEAEFRRLDQRHRIGERLTCVSWAGLYDLNGNVNEWVNLPKEKPPNRSGLKGGWWGPVRNRCRPTVTFHKENDYGYEQGFRCCKDASG